MDEVLDSGAVDTGASTATATPPAIETAPVEAAAPVTTDVATAAPVETAEAAPVIPSLEGVDIQTLPENVRSYLDYVQQQNEKLKPVGEVAEWIDTRGGREFVQNDLALVDYAWAEDPDERTKFHETFYNQSPEAYLRFLGDITSSPDIQAKVLTDLGLHPQLLDSYKQVGIDGTWQGGQVQADQVDPAFVSTIKPELQEVFKSLPLKVQQDYSMRDKEVMEYDLQQAKVAFDQRKAFEAQQVQLNQERQQAAAQAVTERQTTTYNGIRDAVKTSVAKAFPSDTMAQEFILNATETEVFGSPEGQALWTKIAGLIQSGEIRKAQAEVPQMIAKAQVIATEKVKYLAGVMEKARKYDALNRQENPRQEIGAARGGQVTNNGTAQPHSDAGQYNPERILEYYRRAAEQAAS